MKRATKMIMNESLPAKFLDIRQFHFFRQREPTSRAGWRESKEKIHEKFPTLSEELMIGCREPREAIAKYNEKIKLMADTRVAGYRAICLANPRVETQKEFAAIVCGRPGEDTFFIAAFFAKKSRAGKATVD